MHPTTLLLTLLTTTLTLAQEQQHPIMPPSPSPPTLPKIINKHPSSLPNSHVILSDVLGTHRPVNLFAGFIRDSTALSARLEDSSLNTTVLAPLNTAITALPRKPWEDPREYEALGTNAYEGQDGSERAARNLEKFVQAHVVPASPWEEGVKVRSLGGGEVWWETRGEKAVVMPGEVPVERIASRVANGEVWILGGVMNYAS